MRPSGCQTERKRSQRRASRHTAQCSTSSRMTTLSAAISVMTFPKHYHIYGHGHRSGSAGDVSADKKGDGLPGQVRQCRQDTYSEIASLDSLAQRLHDVGKVLEMRVDRQSAAIRLQRMLVV